MLYQDYVNLTQQISQAVDDKKFEIALQLLDRLVQSDLPDIDKSFMSINCGVVWDKAGNVHEALRWYDRAIQYEKPHHRFFARQEKAAYLLRINRKDEALEIYRDLLTKPFLSLAEQERLRAQLSQAEAG